MTPTIRFTTATMEQAPEICDLMRKVYESMEDRSLFVCDDEEFVRRHISSEGFTVLAVTGSSEIVGCFILRFPGNSADNLGRDIGLPERALAQVVHMESCVVSPAFRGQGLQLAMLQFAESLLDNNKYRYLMATVSPNNPASFRTFEKNGYRVAAVKEKYGGFPRRIYLKEL